MGNKSSINKSKYPQNKIRRDVTKLYCQKCLTEDKMVFDYDSYLCKYRHTKFVRTFSSDDPIWSDDVMNKYWVKILTCHVEKNTIKKIIYLACDRCIGQNKDRFLYNKDGWNSSLKK
ncbi:hypothetical protein BH23THE1_BH23THE1_26370 [soil metagenome]